MNLMIISHKYPSSEYKIYKENNIYTLWKNNDDQYKIHYNLHKFDDVVNAVNRILEIEDNEESNVKRGITHTYLLDMAQFIYGERRMIYNIELSTDDEIAISNNISTIEDFVHLITHILKKID